MKDTGFKKKKKKHFCPKNWENEQKMGKKEDFLNLLENLVIFFNLVFIMKVFVVLLHKSHIRQKFGSWDISQNALSQSDYRVFKSTISLEQNDEKA